MTYLGVKFKTKFIKKEAPKDPRIEELKYWCKEFHKHDLAPPYEEGSFGNLSFRLKEGEDQFIITGSKIGLKDELKEDSFVKVVSCDFEKGVIEVCGLREPSSESMLHFAIYQKRSEINAVFHGHSLKIQTLAKKLKIPQTKKEEPYGTPDLVQSVLEILDKGSFLLMKNHGFLALGKAMQEAGEISLKYAQLS